MANKYYQDCVDRTLRDLCNIDQPFGDKIVDFGGYLRQVLPVLQHADRANIVNITITRWRH